MVKLIKNKVKSLELINQISRQFKAASIKTYYLDTLIILETILQTDRATLLSNKILRLSNKQIKLLNKYISERLTNRPISQIVQYTEFYGHRFYINNHVMKPRPESESFIDLVVNLIKRSSELKSINDMSLLDLGTGSGALAISTKLAMPNINILASDISLKALRVAKINAALHTTDIKLFHSDLLKSIPLIPTILIANLPYIPLMVPIDKSTSFEPKLSIFGGPDGLYYYRKLFKEMHKYNIYPLYILIEGLIISHSKLIELAGTYQYRLIKQNGLVLLFMKN